METTFLVILTLLFVFFQTYGASSSNTTMTASSNVTCIERERQSLLLIKQGHMNESNRLSTWTGVKCCGWEGVWCDERTGHVAGLDLSWNQLSGPIPPSLGGLSSLIYLYLDGNQLSGSIPKSIGLLTRLRELRLDGNRLSGSIPESIGLLTRLQDLSLRNNQLSGSIPTSVGQLSNLEILDLNNNSLSGFVSEIHFTKLNHLTYLWLDGNPSLSLNVSPHWIPPFQLRLFRASSCNMGPQFPKWLQTQKGLEILELSKSGIRDIIPEWFQFSSHLRFLDLSDNQIHGNLPRIITNNTGTKL